MAISATSSSQTDTPVDYDWKKTGKPLAVAQTQDGKDANGLHIPLRDMILNLKTEDDGVEYNRELITIPGSGVEIPDDIVEDLEHKDPTDVLQAYEILQLFEGDVTDGIGEGLIDGFKDIGKAVYSLTDPEVRNQIKHEALEFAKAPQEYLGKKMAEIAIAEIPEVLNKFKDMYAKIKEINQIEDKDEQNEAKVDFLRNYAKDFGYAIGYVGANVIVGEGIGLGVELAAEVAVGLEEAEVAAIRAGELTENSPKNIKTAEKVGINEEHIGETDSPFEHPQEAIETHHNVRSAVIEKIDAARVGLPEHTLDEDLFNQAFNKVHADPETAGLSEEEVANRVKYQYADLYDEKNGTNILNRAGGGEDDMSIGTIDGEMVEEPIDMDEDGNPFNEGDEDDISDDEDIPDAGDIPGDEDIPDAGDIPDVEDDILDAEDDDISYADSDEVRVLPDDLGEFLNQPYVSETSLSEGTSVYHGTSGDNIGNLLREGIDTRAPGNYDNASTLGEGFYTYNNPILAESSGDFVIEFETSTNLDQGYFYEHSGETEEWLNDQYSIDQYRARGIDYIETKPGGGAYVEGQREIKFHNPQEDLKIKSVTYGDIDVLGGDNPILIQDPEGNILQNPNFDVSLIEDASLLELRNSFEPIENPIIDIPDDDLS